MTEQPSILNPAQAPLNATPAATAPVAQQAPANVLDGPSAAAQPTGQPSGGFLNDLGVNWDQVSMSNDPTDGTHRCYVTKSEIKTKKDNSRAWVFTYRIADGEPQAGKTKQEWRALPVVVNGHFATEKDESAASWLKQRLVSLGIPESRVGQAGPADVQGVECYVTLATAKGWQNVTKVQLASEVQAAMGNLQAAGGTAPQPGTVQGLI